MLSGNPAPLARFVVCQSGVFTYLLFLPPFLPPLGFGLDLPPIFMPFFIVITSYIFIGAAGLSSSSAIHLWISPMPSNLMP